MGLDVVASLRRLRLLEREGCMKMKCLFCDEKIEHWEAESHGSQHREENLRLAAGALGALCLEDRNLILDRFCECGRVLDAEGVCFICLPEESR